MNIFPGLFQVLYGGIKRMALNYVFYDNFESDAAAPLSSPRTPVPGPGATQTIVDTNSTISISGQQLTFSGINAVADRVASTATLARVAGRALIMYHTDVTSYGASGGTFRMGWATLATDSNIHNGFDFSAGSYRLKSGNTAVLTVSIASVPAWYAMIMRATGGLALRRTTSSGAFRLEWVYALLNTAQFHKIYLNTAETRTIKVKPWIVADLPAPFTTDAGIATAITASPASGATSTMTPDGLVEFTWTVGAAEVLELDIRRTDSNNRWIIRCDQVGGTIKLIEKNAGVETERATNSQTWTALSAYRILAIADGQSIQNWVGLSSTDALTAKNSYATAAFNVSEGGIAVAGFATGAGLIAWPRYITIPGV